MSFDIHRFLEEIVKHDLTDLAMKNPYFGAGIISGGVEFLGACLDTHPIDDEGKSASRFCLAVNELFPASYHSFSRPAPYTKASNLHTICILAYDAVWRTFCDHRAYS